MEEREKNRENKTGWRRTGVPAPERQPKTWVIAAILICAAVTLIFSIATLKCLMECNDLSGKAEQLSSRVEVLDDEFAQEITEAQEIVQAQSEPADDTQETVQEITEAETQQETETIEETQETETQTTQQSELDLDVQSLYLDEAQAQGEQWAVSVIDLIGGASYNVNADVQMQSASVIKVFIMATVYGRACYPANEDTAIYIAEQYDGELRSLLESMITVSDNSAANRLVELLGGGDFETGKDVVNSWCRENGYAGTHLGRQFLAENPTDDNYTTAADCAGILKSIYDGTCVCAEASGKMLGILQEQTVKTKIPAGLPSGILSANKTGEMPEGYGLGCIENDIAIVYGENRDYVICVLSNELQGRNSEAQSRIAAISAYVYGEIG